MKTPTKGYLLKCPFCGGPPNQYQVIGIQSRSRIKVLVECWSGDLNKQSHFHLFIVNLKLKTVTKNIEEIFYEEPQAVVAEPLSCAQTHHGSEGKKP